MDMEKIDICDERGNPTGETVDRKIAHRDGILHRTASMRCIYSMRTIGTI